MSRIEEVDQRVDARMDTDEFLWRLTKVQRALRGAMGRLKFANSTCDELLESVRNTSRVGPEAEPGQEDSDQQHGDDGFLETTSPEGELQERSAHPLPHRPPTIRVSMDERLLRLHQFMRAVAWAEKPLPQRREDRSPQGQGASLDEVKEGFPIADLPKRGRICESGIGEKSLERSDQRAQSAESGERERARRTSESKQQSPVLPQKEYRLPPDSSRRTRREGNSSDTAHRIDAAEGQVRNPEKAYALTREPSRAGSERGTDKEFRLNDRSRRVGGDVAREEEDEIPRRER